MKNYVVAIEPEHSKEIQMRLKKEKKQTGKSIKRIVTDILLSDKNFVSKNRENKDPFEN